MENATNAIRIAGGVLIALLVVSLLVYGVVRLRNYQNTVDDTTKNQQVTEFNQGFESYNKKVISGYQMVSLANLVLDTNDRYGQNETQDYTPVKVWIRLQNPYGQLPGASGSNVNTDAISNKYKKLVENQPFVKNIDGKKYYNLAIYIVSVSRSINTDNGTAKQFKNMYFECEGTTYDSREYPKLCEMRFREIKQAQQK